MDPRYGPIYSCVQCAEDYSWPKEDLSVLLNGDLICINCLDGLDEDTRTTPFVPEADAEIARLREEVETWKKRAGHHAGGEVRQGAEITALREQAGKSDRFEALWELEADRAKEAESESFDAMQRSAALRPRVKEIEGALRDRMDLHHRIADREAEREDRCHPDLDREEAEWNIRVRKILAGIDAEGRE